MIGGELTTNRAQGRSVATQQTCLRGPNADEKEFLFASLVRWVGGDVDRHGGRRQLAQRDAHGERHDGI